MKPTQCSNLAMSPGLVVLLTLVLVSAAPSPSQGKRFDCRMFCRSTGFRGSVGGCRCSFTLFTAKRSIRDPEDAMLEAAANDGRYFTLADLVRMTQNAPSTYTDGQFAYASDDEYNPESHELPRNHPVRLMDRTKNTSAEESTGRVGRSLSDSFLKRREFEQDLDNGDTSDFLRRPY
ncbi:hypothetical protein O3P69_000246 [Scylla paramamosain]|uniref:Uncharacterized protein n=1 Tax=Scylla paramamosain TaxID=85552 RepID=A0AAW0UWF5_SCYPA